MHNLSTFLLSLAATNNVLAAPQKTQQPRRFNIRNGNSFGIPGNANYNYVIIEGGTVEDTIATRLAEDPNNWVAIIEAGGLYEVEEGIAALCPIMPLGKRLLETKRAH